MIRILLILVALGGTGGGLWYFDVFKGEDDDQSSRHDGETFAARRGDLKITVTENGSLMAKDSRKVVTKARSSSKITWVIDEGTQVEEGAVLCKMDGERITQNLEQVVLDIVQSEANLKSAKTEVEIQATENEASLEKAKIALEKAEKELERYVKGDAPQERRKLEISIKDKETEHGRAKKRFEDSKMLIEQDYIKKSELEDHQIQFEKAVVGLEGSKLDLQLFEEYTYPMTLKDKQTAVKDAKRELDAAGKRAESRQRQKEVAVVQHEKRLKRYNERKKRYEDDLEAMVLKAPCPGMVIYGDPKNPWMRQNIKVGGDIWGGNTIFTIPDLRVMQVKLSIHEADIIKIKNDQTARVTMDTYPGVLLTGKVVKIASIANSSNPWSGSQSQVKKFDVVITIDDTQGIELKPGISAKAEIDIEERPNVIYIPLQSTFEEEGKSFCNVVTADGFERREITVGSTNAKFAEVTRGLDEGEEVLLYNPDLGASNTAVSDADEASESEGAAKKDAQPGVNP